MMPPILFMLCPRMARWGHLLELYLSMDAIVVLQCLDTEHIHLFIVAISLISLCLEH